MSKPKKGIAKVGLQNPNDPNLIQNNGQKYPRFITVNADREIVITAEYTRETSLAEQKRVKWISKPLSGAPYTSADIATTVGETISISIPAKYCGPDVQVLEALTDEPENKYPTMIIVAGKADNIIKSSTWSLNQGGANIKNGTPINYGDSVWLHLETEGVNGCLLDIGIYNKEWGDDNHIYSYHAVRCINGEVNLHIKNTFVWRKKINWTDDTEEFYVKVSLNGAPKAFLKDKQGDDKHAVSLKVKNNVSSETSVPSQINKPLRVGQNMLNLKRYEPCKFVKIEVLDVKDKFVLFDEGKLDLKNEVSKQFAITREIHYDFDKAGIRKDAEKVLDELSTFLNDIPYIPVELGSHTDIRGTDEYNNKLSLRRAKSAVEYLVGKGVSSGRITSAGYGKSMLLIPGENLTNEEHQKNRRTTLRFLIYGNDALSMMYDTVAPGLDSDFPKELTMTVEGLETKKCLQSNTKHKHSDDVIVYNITDNNLNPSEYKAPQVKHKVYSNISKFNVFPLAYIWPENCELNHFYYHINSCRYFSDKSKAAVIVNVYPDIKWTFKFALNLTNELGVTWQNQTVEQHKSLQKKAGKIGAERRWEQKDASWSINLKGEWNKAASGNFERNKEFNAEFETKLKKLYDAFSSFGAIVDGITSKTKGNVRNIGLKGMPFVFVIQPPNISFEAQWCIERAKKHNRFLEKVGTKVDITIGATPLIGVQMTIDLLCSAVGVVAGAISGGTAAPGAMKLYGVIKDRINNGVNGGALKVSGDVYIDLVVSSTINITYAGGFNTKSDNSDSQVKAEAATKLQLELKVGLWVKGEVSIVVVTAEGYFQASGKGVASITHRHSFIWDNTGAYFRPELGFDGLTVEYTVSIKVGLSNKKPEDPKNKKQTQENKVNSNDEIVLAENKIQVLEKFDLMKALEELFGFEAKIPIIKSS